MAQACLWFIKTRPIEQTYDIEGANHGFIFKLDYDKPLGKPKNSFSAGLNANSRTIDNDQAVNNYDYLLQQYMVNNGLTNNFVFTSNIYSAYASFNLHTTNNWSFRIGGRGELTDMGFDLSTLAQQYNIKPYINIFPNMSVSRMFKDRYTVGLSYGGRINRPREYALNPQIETVDSTNISYGNPDLKPSYTQQIDLSFGMFQKKWSIYPRLGYSNTTDIIERITSVSIDGISQSTYDNVSASQYYTMSLYGNYRPNKRVNFNGGGTFGRIIYQSSSAKALSRNGYSLNCKAGVSIDLKNRLAFEGNMNYYSNTAAQRRTTGSVSTSFGMRKTFMKNKLRFRLMAVNPFNQTNNHVLIEGPNFTTEAYSTVNTRNFSASISYNFTKVGRNSLSKQKKEVPLPEVQP